MTIIEGDICPGYEAIGQTFKTLFDQYGEIGAGLCVIHEGETVIDIWGGTRNKAGDIAWEGDTRSNLFSASKAVVAVAVLQLAERGQLQLDAPVADYWPEFAANGKAAITLRQVLCHRSGLNAFHERIGDEDIFSWQAITAAITAETPWWEPGTRQGYSPMIYGWLLGEVVRRVSGLESFDAYVQQHICAPLGLQLQFGLQAQQVEQVADLQPLKVKQQVKGGSLIEVMRSDPRGVANRAFSNPPTLLMGTNQPAWRQAQIPAANGQSSARDLARFYASLVDLTDERLLSAASRPWLWEQQSEGLDLVLNNPLSISLGFMRLLPEGVSSSRHFCHPGAGGTLGYADVDRRLAFGYVTRGMGQAVLFDERAEQLLSAVYHIIQGG